MGIEKKFPKYVKKYALEGVAKREKKDSSIKGSLLKRLEIANNWLVALCTERKFRDRGRANTHNRHELEQLTFYWN